MADDRFDIVVVGAGMAGASLAAELAENARVLVLEGEDRPGYHTTGRSAAFWTESYGGPGVQPLTSASGPLLSRWGMLSPRMALTIARAEQSHQVEAFARTYADAGVEVEVLDHAGMQAHIPGLRAEWTCGALEPSCSDIDVAGLHARYLAKLRERGAKLWCRARLTQASRSAPGWHLTLADGRTIRATLVINAAGAWADPVAMLCGARPLGITPLRRTIAQLRVSPQVPERLPLVLDIAERFYFKPDTGRLWLSPHDETPSEPCDAAPDELDVAVAIQRLERVVDWDVERVEHRWAGLRSFAPDRLPVYGFDAEVPGLFWFAGQGGFGIQTAPAAARLAAGLVLGREAGDIDPGPYSPLRFGG